MGVDQIVNLAVPFLLLVYPIAILLIVLNVFDKFVPNNNFYIGATIGTLLISATDSLGFLGINLGPISTLISKLPLASAGFSWVTPALVVGIIFSLFSKKTMHETIQIQRGA
jgi:LIVCS family branched-chain amino acid:cation transporter